MDKIEIKLSKSKLISLLFIALIFVLLGVLFIIFPVKFCSSIFNSPKIIKIIGFVSCLFFGVAGISIFFKLFDTKIGLSIDKNGICDNSNASSIGLIQWENITKIKTVEVASTKFLLIYVDNPEFYLEKSKGFKRKLLEGNNKMYGTPLSIISNSLKIKFGELEKLMLDYFEKYKNH
jgi:hypothetical protein